MTSVNKVTLLGNLGRDPDIRKPDGLVVAHLSIATSSVWRDKQGQRQTETDWHRVVLFNRLAEVAEQYLQKGNPVYIEGRLHTRKWQDKEGRDQYSTEIIAEQLLMLGRLGGGGRTTADKDSPETDADQAMVDEAIEF